MAQGRIVTDGPTVYAVRLTARARTTIEDEWERLAQTAGTEVADRFLRDMDTAFASLATYPERCARAKESASFAGVTVRQLLTPPRRPRWRLLFTVHPADENDPPVVRVQFVRHTAQAPLTEWPDTDDEA